MENTNKSSSNLIIWIILGILIIGGIFLYIRGQEDTTTPGGADINVTLPTDTNGR